MVANMVASREGATHTFVNSMSCEEFLQVIGQGLAQFQGTQCTTLYRQYIVIPAENTVHIIPNPLVC